MAEYLSNNGTRYYIGKPQCSHYSMGRKRCPISKQLWVMELQGRTIQLCWFHQPIYADVFPVHHLAVLSGD